RPPVSDVRATLSWFEPLWFSLTRQPSYCSKNVFVGVSLSCVDEPTKNGGSVLPEETLRTMKFGAPKLLFAARTSVAPWNSETAANSTTIESPSAKLYGEALVLKLWVKKSTPVKGPPPVVWM